MLIITCFRSNRLGTISTFFITSHGSAMTHTHTYGQSLAWKERTLPRARTAKATPHSKPSDSHLLMCVYLGVKNDSLLVSGWLRKWDPSQAPDFCCSELSDAHIKNVVFLGWRSEQRRQRSHFFARFHRHLWIYRRVSDACTLSRFPFVTCNRSANTSPQNPATDCKANTKSSETLSCVCQRLL